MKKAFTLIEILIVVILIGIMVSFSLPFFGRAKEKTADKEASSNLKLIQAAERLCKIDNGNYYPSSGTVSDMAAINQNLNLFLLTGSQRNWDYAVWSTGCARATRNGGDGRSWYMTIDDVDYEPNSGAGCP